MTPDIDAANSPSRLRKTGLSLTVWVFSVCTTLLLIGLWGRAVASDQVTLEESTRAVLESELVNDRVVAWLGEGFAAAESRGGSDAAELVARLESAPEMQRAVDNLIDEVVAAALAPPGKSSVIDVAVVLAPVIPVVRESVGEDDLAAGLNSIQSTVDELSPIVLPAAPDAPGNASVAEGAVSVLNTVGIAALMGMLLTGGAATWLSADPVARLRELAIRVSVSAVTFAVILRAGSWAVDPRGGRSPIAAGGAVLLASNGMLLAMVALAAAASAAVLTVWVKRRRVRAAAAS
jgi:hypothetical protein